MEDDFIVLFLGFTQAKELNVTWLVCANSHSPLFQLCKDGYINAKGFYVFCVVCTIRIFSVLFPVMCVIEHSARRII